MQVSGDIRLGETESASTVIFRQLTGPFGRLLQFLVSLGPATLGIVGILLFDRAGATDSPLYGVWLVVCLIVIFLPLIIQTLARRALRAGRLARGATETTHCAFDLEADGMAVRWEGVRHWTAWDKVTDIILHRNMWVIVGSLSYCLPRRWFADAAAERAFLADLLAHLSPEALARSRDAVLARDGKAIAWSGYAG